MLYRLQDVVVEFGAQRLLGPLSLQQNPGEKLVLLGRNGSGKSTLLRLIAGELEPSQGGVERSRGLRVAYLEQILRESPQTSVLQFVLSGLPGLLELEARHEELMSGFPHPQVAAALAELEEQLERLGAGTARPRAQALLQGLGIPQELHLRPLAELSGGQRTRVALAKALFSPCDLLLLDEPSNHLDLVGSSFLAQTLAEYKGAVLLVTHDRYLVDALGGDILELVGGRLERYPGPLARYEQERQRRREQQLRAWELQQQEIERQEEFIRRNIAGQNTRQAQARRKLLAKLQPVTPPPPEPPVVKLRWPEGRRSGDRVLEVHGLSVGYTRPVVQEVNFVLRRGERVALVGPNGSGKTTLLRALAGLLPPLSGAVRLGAGVTVGYADQEQAPVRSGTPLELLVACRPDWTPAEARSWAGAFGFSGERAETPCSVLSGGERSRLQLALLLAEAPNLLLLDEPTNHLDLPTCRVLEQSLKDFPGAVLLVSHDRALVESVATGVFLLNRGRLETVNSVDLAFQQLGLIKASRQESKVPGPRRSPQAEVRRRLTQELSKVERELAAVERELVAIEARLGELEAALSQPEVATDMARLRELAGELEATRARQGVLWQQWCETAERADHLRKNLEESCYR